MSFLRTKRPLTAAQRRNGARSTRHGQLAPRGPESVDMATESVAGEEDPGASLDQPVDAGVESPTAERDHAPRRWEKSGPSN